MTKFADKIKRATAMIKSKGSQCTWTKNTASTGSDPTPWFPDAGTEDTFQVDIVFVPLTAQRYATISYNTQIGGPVLKLFGYMAGGQNFTPEEGDKITLPDSSTMTVSFINTTQPDNTAIIYEIGMS